MKLELKKSSWKTIFETIRQSDIDSFGNFWAAIQSLEEQFENENNNKTNNPG